MGDRANIKIKQHNKQNIYLYSHWGGDAMPAKLQKALRFAKPRWSDEPYATRILVSQVIRGHEDEETGWGLSTYRTDNERDVLEVNFEADKVRLLNRDGWHNKPENWEQNAKAIGEWTLGEFCDIPDISWEKLVLALAHKA